MPFTVTAKLDGLDAVLRRLASLKQGVRNRILRKALTAAARPMQQTAKELAPKESGLLRRSITVKVQTTGKGEVVAKIGPKRGLKKSVKIRKDRVFRQRGRRTVKVARPTGEQLSMLRDPVRYAHLVEKGTVMRQAKPFLQPAFDQNKAQAESTIARIVGEEIEKLARK